MRRDERAPIRCGTGVSILCSFLGLLVTTAALIVALVNRGDLLTIIGMMTPVPPPPECVVARPVPGEGAVLCRWACDDPVCAAACVPECAPPVCELACAASGEEPAACAPPACATRCPPDASGFAEECPRCETVCEPADCPAGAVTTCAPLCEATACAWRCRPPLDCPPPACVLQCEAPACAAQQ